MLARGAGRDPGSARQLARREGGATHQRIEDRRARRFRDERRHRRNVRLAAHGRTMPHRSFGGSRRVLRAGFDPMMVAISRRPGLLTAGAVAIPVTLWASAFVGIRAAGAHFAAGPLALGRLLIGCLVLGAFAFARGEPRPGRRELPLIAVCGLLWFGLYNVALNAAEQRVDAGTAAMLVNVGPILVAVLAAALLGEGFPRPLVAGCAVAFLGVAIIALATTRSGISFGAGPLLCLLAAAAYASGVVAQKVVLRRVTAVQTTFLCCLVGALACLPFAPSLCTRPPGPRRGTSPGSSTWASSRPRSRSRPGRMRSRGARPAGSARQPTSFRRSRSCSGG